MSAYSLGIDYGTGSVRALIVRCSDGKNIASHAVDYPSGTQGVICSQSDHNLARQNPADYLHGLELAIRTALQKAEQSANIKATDIIGIGVDATGSTPLPLTADNQALSSTPEFTNNPNAMAWLWKDHTSITEAQDITRIAKEQYPELLDTCGGAYSSEWFWAKLWHCLNTDPQVYNAAATWVELSDWIPSILSGITNPIDITRNSCAAGHKALYNTAWGGPPPQEFLNALDPKLAPIGQHLQKSTQAIGSIIGYLSPKWAQKTGLPAKLPISAGALDAHMGAVGGAIADGVLVNIMGTSSCQCAISPLSQKQKNISGISGIANESILPNYIGIEGGQSAVGDIFAWFIHHICRGDESLHATLSSQANNLKPGQTGLLALDWNNGNRNPYADPELCGLLIGQSLHTTQADIYRALIEATAFGARQIIEQLQANNITINRIICCGGLADKNPLLMQIYADITGLPLELSASDQSCALGSAVAGAVAATAKNGGYDAFPQAIEKMCHTKELSVQPNPTAHKTYNQLYQHYKTLSQAFATNANLNLQPVMKELLQLKKQQSA